MTCRQRWTREMSGEGELGKSVLEARYDDMSYILWERKRERERGMQSSKYSMPVTKQGERAIERERERRRSKYSIMALWKRNTWRDRWRERRRRRSKYCIKVSREREREREREERERERERGRQGSEYSMKVS